MSTSILHLFFFTCFILLKIHYLDHILECPIGPSLKVVQLRRLFDWTNMAAALHQFFGAARHPCFEVSGLNRWPIHSNLLFWIFLLHSTVFVLEYRSLFDIFFGHAIFKIFLSSALENVDVFCKFFCQSPEFKRNLTN